MCIDVCSFSLQHIVCSASFRICNLSIVQKTIHPRWRSSSSLTLLMLAALPAVVLPALLLLITRILSSTPGSLELLRLQTQRFTL